MTCFDQQDLLPYNTNESEIGRLKRIIAIRERTIDEQRRELSCYRNVLPGWRFVPRTGILVDVDQLPMDD